jgi:enoyl-[acyl-carrier protein] reductase II
MVSAAESPVHSNWKDGIVAAKETDTVFLNRQGPGPALRALRTERTTRLELEPSGNIFGEMARAKELYFGGDMEAAIALTGQVAGRIGSVRPVKEILDGIMAEYAEAVAALPAA